MQQARAHELDTPAVQERGTNQCWWLALLEVARSTSSIDAPFTEKGGTLFEYFRGRRIPAVGDLPERTTFNKITEGSKEVYGPEWQRMIMYYLLDGSQKFVWYLNRTSAFGGDRIKKLRLLLRHLGVSAITIEKNQIEVPQDLEAFLVKAFEVTPYVLVDRSSYSAQGVKLNHCMSGRVVSADTISVYNQLGGAIVPYGYRKDKAGEGMFASLNPARNTPLDSFIALEIEGVGTATPAAEPMGNANSAAAAAAAGAGINAKKSAVKSKPML